MSYAQRLGLALLSRLRGYKAPSELDKERVYALADRVNNA